VLLLILYQLLSLVLVQTSNSFLLSSFFISLSLKFVMYLFVSTKVREKTAH
jgi:hypothetical protein